MFSNGDCSIFLITKLNLNDLLFLSSKIIYIPNRTIIGVVAALFLQTIVFDR
jgi:hypothetical protein